MNRPLNFRAWHRYAKKMCDVMAFNPQNNTAYLSHYQVVGKEGDDVLEKVKSAKHADDDYSVELMQYIGIDDANGKPIYEGDIVKWRNGVTGQLHKVVVQWQYDFAGFYPFHNSTILPSEIEVVGNIFENPELLNA